MFVSFCWVDMLGHSGILLYAVVSGNPFLICITDFIIFLFPLFCVIQLSCNRNYVHKTVKILLWLYSQLNTFNIQGAV